MRRVHTMPFGTSLNSDRTVTFRLWAPGIRTVSINIDNRLSLNMSEMASGWFEYTTDEADIGSRYCFQIGDGLCVPDPASRYNPEDVHACSQVIDPESFDWQDSDWRGRPWEESIIYELHTGAFTSQGSFAGVLQKLDYLASLGVTAIELMPIADFPGSRNWGYDGALLYAPDNCYGTPDDLKRLIQAAHQRDLMVFLDVVYNHFGPEGNYLHLYAPPFFSKHHHTPWGAAINFDENLNRTVRDFYIHNALFWLEEYHIDGLRLDAVHAIIDDSHPDILEELADVVHQKLSTHRHVHLILENDHNAAHYLTRDKDGHSRHFAAQWNDDFHHACHVLLTGEHDGYYVDYADQPISYLGRSLVEGFAYQGEPSTFRQGESRGEASTQLPPAAFVIFLQNHDQIGNRAFGDRLARLVHPAALHAAIELLLLAPFPLLLFMGEEWCAEEPFPFFCNFSADIAHRVTSGRRMEFSNFIHFSDPIARQAIPDPQAAQTFQSSQLDWSAAERSPHRETLALYRHLLALRHQAITPILGHLRGEDYQLLGPYALQARWRLRDGGHLKILANLGADKLTRLQPPRATVLYVREQELLGELNLGNLPPYTVVWYLEKQDVS